MTNLFLEFFFISLFSRKIEMEWKMHDRKTNVIDFSGIVLIEMKRLMYVIRVNWGLCPDGFQMFFWNFELIAQNAV